MTFDLEAKSMYTFKRIGHNWMNEKTVAKYTKLVASGERILFAFPNSSMVESGFRHVHYLQSKQRNTLNIECGYLCLKLANLSPNIPDLPSARHTHLFHIKIIPK